MSGNGNIMSRNGSFYCFLPMSFIVAALFGFGINVDCEQYFWTLFFLAGLAKSPPVHETGLEPTQGLPEGTPAVKDCSRRDSLRMTTTQEREGAVGEDAVGEDAVGENAVGENAVGENALAENAVCARRFYATTAKESEPCIRVDSSQPHRHSVAVSATLLFLGCCVGSAARQSLNRGQLGEGDTVHMLLLVAFHCGEFCFVCKYHPASCSWDGFLFNNGWQYTFCVYVALVERLAWRVGYAYLTTTPRWQGTAWQGVFGTSPPIVSHLRLLGSVATYGGLGAACAGLLVRWAAFRSAGSNFTHKIAQKGRPGFSLTTTGVYRVCRHPAYLGWFLYAVGSQLAMLNPLCTILYWRWGLQYLRDRIALEESYLCEIFGNDYRLYRYRTSVL